MTYLERRLKLEDLAAQAAEIISQVSDPDSRALLVERHNDAVMAALDGSHHRTIAGLRERFTESARAFWLRDNQLHSIKERPNLRVVK